MFKIPINLGIKNPSSLKLREYKFSSPSLLFSVSSVTSVVYIVLFFITTAVTEDTEDYKKLILKSLL